MYYKFRILKFAIKITSCAAQQNVRFPNFVLDIDSLFNRMCSKFRIENILIYRRVV